MSALINKGKFAMAAVVAAAGLAGALVAPATASAQTVVVRTGPDYHHHWHRHYYRHHYYHPYHPYHRDWHRDGYRHD